jgi:NAD(P)-dependent dehydrogenase (short-subunit alcohol dehydrogenase family)
MFSRWTFKVLCPISRSQHANHQADENTIKSAAEKVKSLFPTKDSYLHLALCLPGILHAEKSPSQIHHDDVLRTFQVNAIGPLLLIKHFSPFLPRRATSISSDLKGLTTDHATWATMSARVGSITDNRAGGWYSYRASKAAVNQINKTLDLYLKTTAGEKAMAIGLHPGTTKTELSKEFWGTVKEHKLFEPEYSAEKLLDVIKSRSQDDRGKCWDWKGEEVPP